MTRRRPYACRPASAVLAVCLLGPAVTACSVDDVVAPGGGATASGSATASATPEPEPVETTASINRVDGDLRAQGRDRLRERIQGAVDAWIDAAYGGDYPRDDFSDAFDTFTAGAVKRAEDDEALMSNAAVGLVVDDVRPTRRRLRIDVLGVDGTAVAVTARVDLALELSGEVARTDRISGSLYLTYEKSGGTAGWRVFGYDMTRKEI